MARILATHLIVQRDRKSFTTACGVAGIPQGADETFADTHERLEGRIPASAGNGVVAETSTNFGFPRAGVRFCGKCMKKFSNGAG